MCKLKTLKVLEHELGEVQKSAMSGESFYYSALWEEIQEEAARIAKAQNTFPPNDVRSANYALDLLGIPNHVTETDRDEAGDWIVYWR